MIVFFLKYTKHIAKKVRLEITQVGSDENQ